MKKKTVAVVALFVVLIFAGLLLLGRSFGSSQPDDNEIRLKIQLDLGEDIGLFLIDSDLLIAKMWMLLCYFLGYSQLFRI